MVKSIETGVSIVQEKILIFIPIYNCSRQITRVLDQLHSADVRKFFHGVVCIDNQSTDGTLEAALSAIKAVPLPHRAVLRNNQNYGLGGSHKSAIQYARRHDFTHLVVLHGDDQGSIADLIPLVASGEHLQYDCLLGGRFMVKSRLVGYSAARTLGNIGFNLLFSLAAGRHVYDLGAGLNLYNLRMFDDNFHQKFADDLTFNCYLLLASCLRNLKQKFFPLTWREDDQISNARLYRQGLKTLNLIFAYQFNKRQFVQSEHRSKVIDDYASTTVYETILSERVGT